MYSLIHPTSAHDMSQFSSSASPFTRCQPRAHMTSMTVLAKFVLKRTGRATAKLLPRASVALVDSGLAVPLPLAFPLTFAIFEARADVLALGRLFTPACPRLLLGGWGFFVLLDSILKLTAAAELSLPLRGIKHKITTLTTWPEIARPRDERWSGSAAEALTTSLNYKHGATCCHLPAQNS